MAIKKLTKEVLEEGITLELVNGINMFKSFTPVQLQKGDEPTQIMPNSKGFWVMIDGKALKDEKGQYIVFGEKECRIGRARYLINYGDQEKKDKIKQLVESWKRQIRERIDNMGRRPHIALQLAFIANGNTYEDIDRIFNSGKEAKAAAEEMWNEGKYIELLEAFEIKKFPNPMYRVRFDSDEDMKVLVNVFGMKALENWDGDMLGKYAAIEIEKQYMI